VASSDCARITGKPKLLCLFNSNQALPLQEQSNITSSGTAVLYLATGSRRRAGTNEARKCLT
jgi:hypothetical protein